MVSNERMRATPWAVHWLTVSFVYRTKKKALASTAPVCLHNARWLSSHGRHKELTGLNRNVQSQVLGWSGRSLHPRQVSQQHCPSGGRSRRQHGHIRVERRQFGGNPGSRSPSPGEATHDDILTCTRLYHLLTALSSDLRSATTVPSRTDTATQPIRGNLFWQRMRPTYPTR